MMKTIAGQFTDVSQDLAEGGRALDFALKKRDEKRTDTVDNEIQDTNAEVPVTRDDVDERHA